jgi:hypothetical protein
MSARRNLGRIHIWLGWLIGTATGLWMVARPIDEVRGVQLKAEPPVLATNATPVFPKLPTDHGAPLSIKLEQQWDGPVWIATFAHGHEMRASASDGRWLPPITEEQARAIAWQWYRPNTEIMSATHSPADAPPIDLRKEKAAWQIAFADGANVYVDADTGSLLAIRSGQWRIFDFMWGLHIMDLQTRENTSHPILILFAILAFIGTVFGLILLPLSARRKRRRQ